MFCKGKRTLRGCIFLPMIRLEDFNSNPLLDSDK